MSDTRRLDILQRAQLELQRARGRRIIRRRRAGSSLAVLAIIATISSAWLLTRERPAAMRPESVATARAPVTLDVPARFEVVNTAQPSKGFAQAIDDLEFELAVRSLAQPTGIAVIGGRTRLVSNPDWRAGEQIR